MIYLYVTGKKKNLLNNVKQKKLSFIQIKKLLYESIKNTTQISIPYLILFDLRLKKKILIFLGTLVR